MQIKIFCINCMLCSHIPTILYIWGMERESDHPPIIWLTNSIPPLEQPDPTPLKSKSSPKRVSSQVYSMIFHLSRHCPRHFQTFSDVSRHLGDPSENCLGFQSFFKTFLHQDFAYFSTKLSLLYYLLLLNPIQN